MYCTVFALIYHSYYMQKFNSCLVDAFNSDATPKRTPWTVFWVNTILNWQQTNCGFYEVFDGHSGGVCLLRWFGIFRNIYSHSSTNSIDHVNVRKSLSLGLEWLNNRNKVNAFLLYLDNTVSSLSEKYLAIAMKSVS